jgi:5-methyltetrahydropteroyltriglutamate--homocysteine methyltransferase
MEITVHRAQTIGSMLRPAVLREARRSSRQGTISCAAFKQIEDRAVNHALAIQERAGIDLVTDGEQRRASFLGSLLETTEGLSRDLSISKPWHEDDEHVTELSLGLAVTGKLRRLRSLVCEEYAYARGRTTQTNQGHAPEPDDVADVLGARVSASNL